MGHDADLGDVCSHADHSRYNEVFDPKLRRVLRVLAVAGAVAAVIGVALLWPSSTNDAPSSLGIADDWFDATVVSVETFVCPGVDETQVPDNADDWFDGVDAVCETVAFELHEGPDAGDVRSVDRFDIGALPEVRVGDRIVVPYLADALDEYAYTQPFERERTGPLLVLAAMFAALVVIQGRLRGFAAIGGLLASVGVLIVFVLPAIVGGAPPVAVAVVAAAIIAYLALYLAHGFTPLTTVALLGSLASLALVAVLSWVFTTLTTLSGFSDEAQYIRAFGGDIDFTGLLLAGMILGALGALDDMTVTQASAVSELKRANPAYTFSDLYRSGSRIGRDHVASTVNTLALAYIGASLPLLLVFVESGVPFVQALTSEAVAAEIVRTLVGSIALVASVPLTTALAAKLVANSTVTLGDCPEADHDAGDNSELADAGPEADDDEHRSEEGLDGESSPLHD